MNILLYVLVIITAISILTYSRLQTFLSTVGIKKEYACFMVEKERAEINGLQLKQYEKHKGTGSKHQNSTPSIDATSFINFRVFIDKEFRENNQSYYNTMRAITFELLEILYRNYTFYREQGDRREELLNKIELQAEKQEIRNSEELKGLDLQDPELQELFAKMLEGGNNISLLHSCAASSHQGYRSLLEFIRIPAKGTKNPVKPIRIQLIPRELLEAIFPDDTTVEEIMQVREKYEKTPVKSGTTEQQVASNAFESQFKVRIPKNLDPAYFNFSITTTKPRS